MHYKFIAVNDVIYKYNLHKGPCNYALKTKMFYCPPPCPPCTIVACVSLGSLLPPFGLLWVWHSTPQGAFQVEPKLVGSVVSCYPQTLRRQFIYVIIIDRTQLVELYYNYLSCTACMFMISHSLIFQGIPHLRYPTQPQSVHVRIFFFFYYIFNPRLRRAQRVTVVRLSVCMSVCLSVISEFPHLTAMALRL